MKKIGFLAVIMLLAALVHGQYEFKSSQYKGYILTEEGKQEGIIWLSGGGVETPWSLQKKVSFITEEDFGKIKKNKVKYFESYKSKQLLGYGFDDVQYESVKFADLSAVGPDMLSKMYFLKVLVQGNLSLYKYYHTPPSAVSGDEVNRTNAEWALDNDIVIKKGESKSKDIDRVDVDELLDDCPTVKDKYLNGEYGFTPKNDGEKKGLGKIWAKMNDRADIEKALILIATEYNDCK